MRSLPAASLVGLLLFLIPAVSHAQPDESIDIRLFRSINDSQSPFLDRVIGFNDAAVKPAVIALPAGFFVYGLGADDRPARVTGYTIGASSAMALLVTLAVKELIRRDRPYVRLSNVHVQHLESADAYSFPSGHAAVAFAAATALSLRYPKPAVIAASYVWAALVGYGRVYLGLHYPSDVLGGVAVGVASGYAMHLLEGEFERLDRSVFRESQVLPAGESRAGGSGIERVSVVVLPLSGGALVACTVSF